MLTSSFRQLHIFLTSNTCCSVSVSPRVFLTLSQETLGGFSYPIYAYSQCGSEAAAILIWVFHFILVPKKSGGEEAL